jgi:hypothetical protein
VSAATAAGRPDPVKNNPMIFGGEDEAIGLLCALALMLGASALTAAAA